jgi:hypothetical protein
MKEYLIEMSTNLMKGVKIYKLRKHTSTETEQSKRYTIIILFNDEINETTGSLCELSAN